MSELRAEVFDLLDHVARAARAGGADPDVSAAVVQLQHVANELGLIEAMVSRPSANAA
ncbi:MAG: hypothetical protein M3N16_04990 [Actinomycetota bacterium]|nr:hypothetical protein [Actinomycetota bacterium]